MIRTVLGLGATIGYSFWWRRGNINQAALRRHRETREALTRRVEMRLKALLGG